MEECNKLLKDFGGVKDGDEKKRKAYSTFGQFPGKLF